jgi:hypothetical protein
VNRIKIELPEAASKKLAQIELAKMSAEDSMRGAQGRINSLPPDATQLRELREFCRKRAERPC